MKEDQTNDKQPLSDEPPETTKGPSKKMPSWMRSALVFGVIFLGAYLAHVELQTYLGKQMLAQTGFPDINLETAITQAKAQNKYIIANMSAIWCPSCRRLDRSVFAEKAVQKLINDNFIFTRAEYESDEGKQFMARYGVNSFPTLLLLSPEGEQVQRIPLTFDPKTFMASLNNYSKNYLNK